MSIGAVSKATGIPPGTLRTWERRYGFPDPERSSSGHRRYSPEVVERLRLTARAVDAGHRPSNVVGMRGSDLRDLLETAGLDRDVDRREETEREPPLEAEERRGWMEKWLRAGHDLDGERLALLFQNAWNRMGGLDCLEERIAPFIKRIGEEWASGRMKVVHEHYVSESLRDFLTSRWRPLSAGSHGPEIVCATVEGELHILGLHIAATTMAMAGWQVVFLGSSTPLDDILEAQETESADAVGISFAESFDPDEATERTEQLRRRLPPQVDLLIGGGGAPEGLEGVKQFESLETLYRWAFDRLT